MRSMQKIAASALVLLLGGTVYWLRLTTGPARVPSSLGQGKRAAPAVLVDRFPREAAPQLATMPGEPAWLSRDAAC